MKWRINYLFTSISVVILYWIVIFILYPSSKEIIQDLGVSLPNYTIGALHICNYLYSYKLIFLSLIICNLFILFRYSKYTIIILNIWLYFLVYLIFSLTTPLLSYTSTPKVKII